MDNRGLYLLELWIEGAISYDEELELFEIAKQDEFLQSALEGYITQGDIVPFETRIQKQQDEVLMAVKSSKFNFTTQAYRSIAAVLVVAIAATVILVMMSNKGELGADYLVDLNLKNKDSIYDNTTNVESELKGSEESKPSLKPALKSKLDKEFANTTEKDEQLTPVPVQMAQLVVEEEIAAVEVNLVPKEAIKDDVSNTVEEQTVQQKVYNPYSDASNNEILTFAYLDTLIKKDEVLSDDAALEQKVKADSRKEAFQYLPITAYDISDKAEFQQIDSLQNLSNLKEQLNSPKDAANTKKNQRINDVKSNKVVSSYEISNYDILNPSVQDYNSLVRARYKRKAKPEIGFLKYKNYLKSSTNILNTKYPNSQVLEEVVLKFRVHQNGDVELLELFGVNNQTISNQIAVALSEGPKWQLAEHYESIDVEVPFKVLFPYLFRE